MCTAFYLLLHASLSSTALGFFIFHCSDVSSTGCWLQRCPCHRCRPSECVSGQGSPMATQLLSTLYVLVSVLQRLKSLRRAPSLTRTNRVPNPRGIPKPISGSPLSKTVSPALPLAVSSLASFLPCLPRTVSFCKSLQHLEPHQSLRPAVPPQKCTTVFPVRLQS